VSDWLATWWPELSIAVALIELGAAGHAVLNKRDVRAAIAWVGFILLLPGIGALLYALLGVNRINRMGKRLRGEMRRYDINADRRAAVSPDPASGTAATLAALLGPDVHLTEIARTLDHTSRWPLLAGNHITLLQNGDEAYPEMLRAIEQAKRSVAFLSYIFDSDTAGRQFVSALGEARDRGVDVRVLVDDAGARYSWPAVDRLLRKRGVRVARFLPVRGPWSVAFANLRNHRKILVVDGALGFTGGMNIREGHVLANAPRTPTRDVHFRLEGPVVGQLARLFAEDWTFATREVLEGDAWFPALAPAGDALARTIPDGPDHDLDCIRWAFHGALASARRSVRIVTPYFLPDEPLITALNVAALRGVAVDVVLPRRSNLRFVDWATYGELWKLMRHGVRVWWTALPFDHSKLLTVDATWSLLGSSNWDPRSLRLNFELGVECYDRTLAAHVDTLIDERIASAERVDADTLASLPFLSRLRNATVRLLSPYL
jgi:cardiolipin synthase A/B